MVFALDNFSIGEEFFGGCAVRVNVLGNGIRDSSRRLSKNGENDPGQNSMIIRP